MPVESSSLPTGAAAGAGKAHRNARAATGGTEAGGVGFLGALSEASDAQGADGAASAVAGGARKSAARAARDSDAALPDPSGLAPAVPVVPPLAEKTGTSGAFAPVAPASTAATAAASTPAASTPAATAGAAAAATVTPGAGAAPVPAPATAVPAEANPANAGVLQAAEPRSGAPGRDVGLAAAPASDTAGPSLFARMQAVLHHAHGSRGAPGIAGTAASPDGAGSGALANVPTAKAQAPGREPTAALHALQSALSSADTALPLALPAMTAAGARREEFGRGAAATMLPAEAPGGPTAAGGDFTDAGVSATAEPPPAFSAAEEEPTRYWGSPALQSAELTVQADGADVAVRVSLAGQEAHVAFRSDHAAARELLASGVGELQSLLAAEGLSLGGVSVGTSQSGRQGDDADGGQQRSADGGRLPPTGATAIDGAAARPTRPTALGALDLYV